MKIQISFREDGSLQPRSLKGDRALIALVAMRARREHVAIQTPTSLRAAFNILMDDSDHLLNLLEEAWGPEPEEATMQTPTPPEDLLRVAPHEILTSVNGLNHLIDSYVGGIESILQGYARGIDPDKTQAAQRLINTFFSDGRVFLSYDNQRQWLQVDQRFTNLAADELQALDTLDLRPSVDITVALNDYFGKLLGVTQAPTQPIQTSRTSQRIQAQDAFDLWISRAISFANLAFSRDTEEDHNARISFLDPYLEPIFKASRTRRRKIATTRKSDELAQDAAPSQEPS